MIQWLIARTKHPKLREKLKRNEKRIMLFLAAQLQFNRAMLFKRGGAYNGHQKWKDPLFRSGVPLSDTGALKNSLAPNSKGKASNEAKAGPGGTLKIGRGKVTIGTTLKKAKLLNYGGTVYPVNGKALMIPLPNGKNATGLAKQLKKGTKKLGIIATKKVHNVMFLRKVVIPPRNFIKLNSADKKEIMTAFKAFILKVLREKKA
jgi:phage gpG-like protein